MAFDEILSIILVPRENGSTALAEVGKYLEQTARKAGTDVSPQEFICQPYAPEFLGVIALVLALVFAVLTWRRRFASALLVALVLPAFLWLESPPHTGLLGRLVTVSEHNVITRFAVAHPERTVILGAHYDSRTDLLDYHQRAPIQFSLVPALVFTALLPLTALWRRWRTRPEGHIRHWSILPPIYFTVFSVIMAGGMLVSNRSPGALDDGASVAILLKLVEDLGTGSPKLEHTDVEVVFFAAKEVGMQGSAEYVARRFRTPPSLPTYFINIEGWGFSEQLSYFTSDRLLLHRFDASPGLVRTLDRILRRMVPRVGLVPDIQPITSDSSSFMAAGIPSVTLGSQRDGNYMIRALHSARDERTRIAPNALEHSLTFLRLVLAEIDANGIELEQNRTASAGM